MPKTSIIKEIKVDNSTYQIEIKKEKPQNGKNMQDQLIENISYFFKRTSKEEPNAKHGKI